MADICIRRTLIGSFVRTADGRRGRVVAINSDTGIARVVIPGGTWIDVPQDDLVQLPKNERTQ